MKLNDYINKLNLNIKSINKIEHEETISSDVYKIITQDNTCLILKFFYNPSRYRRELYYLQKLENLIPVPKVIEKIEPEADFDGAILMECLKGEVITPSQLTHDMAFKMGKLMGQLHETGTDKYGDLANPQQKETDPIQEMLNYLNESISECNGVISSKLLDKCINYFNDNMVNTDIFDGPCIIHRDFKPGNVIFYKDEIQGVIDWEGARSGFAQDDFMRMDRFIWSKDESSKEPFLKGYATIRAVPELEELLPLLRISKALGAIGFAIKRNSWQTQNKIMFKANLSFIKDFFINI